MQDISLKSYNMKPQFLIAAPSSNSGKTTLTLGILRLLSDRGYTVQPFKCGPDYLDTKHHSLAAGRPGINLDSYMMTKEHVKELYARYAANADVAVVEGVMGLFDGARRMEGSSAEIANLLSLPVILIVDAHAMAYSAAPLIYGFKNFLPGLHVAGVIFNRVNAGSHYRFLEDACEDAGVPTLGYIPYNEEINIPSRYLGLSISLENNYEAIIRKAAAHIIKTVDVEKLLSVVTVKPPEVVAPTVHERNRSLKIAVASDEAFNFIYHENIAVLQQLGEVTYFSPLKDAELPDTDFVYLAGGYPELHLRELSNNTSMRRSLYDYCTKGGRVHAECGGMMYLGKHITDKEGNTYPAAGFLDITTSLHEQALSLGYRSVLLNGKVYKGHEFHYSTLKEIFPIPSVGQIRNARNEEVATKLYRKDQVIASYIHFYWGENRDVLRIYEE